FGVSVVFWPTRPSMCVTGTDRSPKPGQVIKLRTDRIISFLKKHDYNVLNLIELRKPGVGEGMTKKIQVGENEFNHY
ncbi:MAG TPA: hypothetical protein VLA72_23095, partial [Anaerolineales bacterium]|nr:hypothetical protein [Anaerolineales bacterium]